MDIGTGIALVGIWLLPSAAYISKTTTSLGLYIAITVAAVMTFVILH